MKYILIIFGILLFLQNSYQINDIENPQKEGDKLIGLSIFIRHGARAPYIEDFYEKQWDNLSRGALTQEGMEQLINLGKKIRGHYINKLQAFSPQFDKKNIQVKFAFISRCLYSLLGFLKGVYPDIYGNKENLSREEILKPVKDVGFSFDFNDYAEFQRDLLFRANDSKNCKFIKHVQQKKLESKKFQAIFKYFRDHPQMESILGKLIKYRKEQDPQYTEDQIEIQSMFHLKEIYDSYLMNKKHGKPVPNWNEQDLHLLQMQYEHFFFKFFGFNEAKLIEASQFFKLLHEILLDVSQEHEQEDNKFYIFSGTKTNIAVFISSILNKEQIKKLGAKKIAPLSAFVGFEFWEQKDGQKYVFVKYGDEYLELEQCKEKIKCTFQEFKILVKTKIYKNLETICDSNIEYSQINNNKYE